MGALKTLIAQWVANHTRPESQFQDRAPRIAVHPLHGIDFRSVSPLPDHSLKLANISTAGAGFLIENPQKGIGRVGDVISGRLSFHQKIFPVTLEICHVSHQMLGCRFMTADLGLTLALAEFLELEVIALGLRRGIHPLIASAQPGEAVWFSDGRHNQLFVHSTAETIFTAQMSFLGLYIELNSKGFFRFGYLDESQQGLLPQHQSAPHVASQFTVRYENLLPTELDRLVPRFLSAVQDLGEPLRAQLIYEYERASRRQPKSF